MQHCFFLLPVQLLLLLLCWWFNGLTAFCPTKTTTTQQQRQQHLPVTTTTITTSTLFKDDSSQWKRRTTPSFLCHPSKETARRSILTRLCSHAQKGKEPSSSSTDTDCWNPPLRRILGGIASVGVLETTYLTWNKLVAGTASTSLPFCNADPASAASCSSVLDGPYAVIPGTDNIPLALAGLVAYLGAAYLALAPTFVQPQLQAESESSRSSTAAFTNKNNDSIDVDLFNRMTLTAWTTTMGIFSTFLMILLLGVLKEQCIYCIASACMSISLMSLCWLGGAIPPQRLQQGIQTGVGGGGLVAFAAMAIILVSNAPQQQAPYFTSSLQQQQEEVSAASRPGTLVASTSDVATSSSVAVNNNQGLEPPPIVSISSQRALDLGNDLQRLNARLYGAYWCSHCYDQKELLGQQAMSKILYIECSKDGRNSQTSLCKEKKVPGYPTWEINGQLYPGEQALEELEELVLVQLGQKMQ